MTANGRSERPQAVTSRDGTRIAVERAGHGPAVVLVDGALSHRALGPSPRVARALAHDFTVLTYDRRGRRESGDTSPYAVAREVEDFTAVIAVAGGSASVCGVSSGAALALEAAASGVAMKKLALYEPPFDPAPDPEHDAAYQRRLAELIGAGRRGDAVDWFLSHAGVPPDALTEMHAQPEWPRFEAVAPMLAYDHAVLDDGAVPADRAAKAAVPTLVGHGEESPGFFRQAAEATAAAIPGARLHVLAGQARGACRRPRSSPAS